MMGIPAHINVEEIRKPELDSFFSGSIRCATIGKTDNV